MQKHNYLPATSYSEVCWDFNGKADQKIVNNKREAYVCTITGDERPPLHWVRRADVRRAPDPHYPSILPGEYEVYVTALNSGKFSRDYIAIYYRVDEHRGTMALIVTGNDWFSGVTLNDFDIKLEDVMQTATINYYNAR